MEWKEIKEHCKKKTTINVFISYAYEESSLYRVEDLANYLEQQTEINQAYFCEEDLKGGGKISGWEYNKIVKRSFSFIFNYR